MERNANRWFRLWILFGAGLAILLLASSVVNYFISSRTTALFNTRREMAREMTALDQLMRAQRPDAASLSRLLEQMVQESNGSLAWAQVVDRQGAVIARSDAAAAPAFTVEYVASQIRERRPVFAVRDTSAGKVVVEAFPIRLPSPASPAEFKVVALQGGTAAAPSAGSMAFVELASFARAGALAWPVRWTLILGLTTGLALLGALVVLVLRFRAHLAARRVERQIEIARQVQRGMLPPATSSPRDFELAAEWRPAASVSGDFYDAFDIPQKDVSEAGAAFVFGDVSGKDVPAAMLASLIQGTAHASDWTRSAANHNAATEQLNRLLCERASQERFASLFWGYFDPRAGLLHYVNCGHCAPLLFRAREQGVVRLSDGGPVLGLLPHARFEQGVERLEAGDVLVLYSDGVVEAANARGEEFGEHRLIATVESCAHPAEIRDGILRAVRDFTGSDVLADDQTLLAIRYTGASVETLETQAA